jgi:hypothetical protein
VRNSPAANALNGVTYYQGLYVAVGGQGTVLTSTNGVDWRIGPGVGGASPLYCAAYGLSGYPYLVGGAGGGFISPDGTSWTNVFSSGSAQLLGAANSSFYWHEYLAVGWDSAISRGSIFASSWNIFDWSATATPTTNVLFAVASTASPSGSALPVLFVAVGDRGTIVSSDGTNWTVRSSGTTNSLRAVVYHQGRMFAGGDHGVVLKSADGISWSAVAPVSFDIRGLASSGNVVVAVGNDLNSGRLQVSADGLSWPGNALQLSNTLNSIAYGQDSFVAVGDNGLVLQSSYAPSSEENAWTKPTSGYWEEAYWSSGHFPSTNDPRVAFKNPGWKALAIGANTTANFSNSLVMKSLTIGAPDGSSNTLLLNYAGTNVPLTVRWYLTIETNASLLSYYSAVEAGVLEVNSSARFAEGSRLKADSIHNYATLSLSDSFTSARIAFVHPKSAIEQRGGSSQFDSINMEANSLFSVVDSGLQANYLQVQNPFFSYPSRGKATFIFDGGNMFVTNGLVLGTPLWDVVGDFLYRRGNLVCSNYMIWNGTFEQSGGTNTIATLALPPAQSYDSSFHADATYRLSAGTLLTGNLSLGLFFMPGSHFVVINPGRYVQSGGIHTNTVLFLNGFLFNPPPGGDQFSVSAGVVSLSGGLLVSSNEIVQGWFNHTGGTNQVQLLSVYGGGSYSLATGTLAAAQTWIYGYQARYNPWSPSCEPATIFVQQSGVHSVANSLIIENFAVYELDTGTVAARDIFVGPASQLFCRSGSVSNWGTFTLEGGSFVLGNQSHSLGQLQIRAVTNYYGSCATGAVSLDLSGPRGTVLRFRDSSSAAWSGPGIQLLGWRPGDARHGSHHIFFGANAQGLTPTQLSKITFVNPSGWPPGNYPARILSTGEVVPAVPPSLVVSRTGGALVLSWPDDSQLLTATNILGPYSAIAGATSPFTNLLADRQRYFRLSLPAQ